MPVLTPFFVLYPTWKSYSDECAPRNSHNPNTTPFPLSPHFHWSSSDAPSLHPWSWSITQEDSPLLAIPRSMSLGSQEVALGENVLRAPKAVILLGRCRLQKTVSGFAPSFFTLKWPFAPFFCQKARFFCADVPMHIQIDHDFICRSYLHMWNLQIRVCISASQIIYLLEQTPKKTPKNRRISPIWCLSPFHAAQGSKGPPSMILLRWAFTR